MFRFKNIVYGRSSRIIKTYGLLYRSKPLYCGFSSLMTFSFYSDQDMLNADLADKLEKQARLREAVKRKKEERRQEMAQERRNRLIEDLKSQGIE